MIFTEGEEPLSFWQTLSDESPETMTEECIPMKPSEMHVPENFQPIIPRFEPSVFLDNRFLTS